MDHRGSINSDENIHTVGAGGGSSNHNGTGLDRDLGAAPGVVHYAFSSSKRDFLAPDPFSPQPAPHRNGAVAVPAAPAAEASPDPSPRSAPARYRECLRNHAASVGGLVVDGCGEFLPAESDALKCSVCGCHRSFHRREPEPGEAAAVATIPRHAAPPPYYYHPYSLSNGGGRRAHGGGGGSGARLRPGAAPPPLLALPPPQSRPQPLKPSPIMSFRGGGGGNESSGGGGSDTDSSSEEMDAYTPVTPAPAHPAPWTQPPPISSRKRFRTKFTSEQKERMLEFAGALGWRMQRRDEGAVERFCAEVGVPRKVFKVWMHNNKHASTAKPFPPQQHQIHPPAADPFSRPPQQQQQQLPHADTYTRPPQQHAQADAYSRPHADTYARPHPPSSPP